MTRRDRPPERGVDSRASAGRDAPERPDDSDGDAAERPANISADNYRGEFISPHLEVADR